MKGEKEKKGRSAMSYVHVCQKCKAVFKYPNQEVHTCPDCNIPLFSTGVSDADWAKLSPQERNEYREIEARRRREALLEEQRLRMEEQRRREEEERRQAQIKEEKKVEYIKSLKDYVYYEYDVDVIQNNGEVNVQRLKNVLDARAKNGWKLHTIYSNELGKNSHMEYSTRINSTASQDVLIFERRIMDDTQR